MGRKKTGGWRRWVELDVHPTVFFTSASLIILFVAFGLLYVSQMESLFGEAQHFITTTTNWFFVLIVDGFLVFTIYLMFSRFGDIKLGGPSAQPEFSYWGWFAMLFSAGMGIGLLFFSVAEPVMHFSNPPRVTNGTADTAQLAMDVTLLHWGLHAWAIYAIVGLALAFFSFTGGHPLTIRAAFYPLLGERIHGPIGHLIDILAVVSTLFGVATSLGLGVQQIAGGLSYLFGAAQTTTLQISLIGGITAMATASVVLGLDSGIRRLSQINMVMGGLLLLFVLALGPTLFLFKSVIQNTGQYLQSLLDLGTWTATYRNVQWQSNWTIFYWAWWISWSPFVGMFIARISLGRTVREFTTGVLFVPTILTIVWITVFGGSALHVEIFGPGGISAAVNEDITTALFKLFEHFPLSEVISVLAMVMVVLFFVTSSDSGSLVIDIITAGGNPDPPVAQRVFWAVLEGVVAAVLLVGGGLIALQAAAITMGLPFGIVLVLMCFSLYKGLTRELGEEEARAAERNTLGDERG